ncbi:MAG: acyl-CoA thioesterase/bile acid-CoA:amino acid N-acyltransferase family protein [Pseudomonadota bacterium]
MARIFLALIAVMVQYGFGSGCASAQAEPALIVSPEDWLVQEDVTIRVVGAVPGGQVVIEAQFTDASGQVWSSRGVYHANEHGEVDTASGVSIAGTYQGIEPRGLIWSVLPSEPSDLPLTASSWVFEADMPRAPSRPANDAFAVRYVARIQTNSRSDDRTTSAVEQTLRISSPNLVRREINERGVRGVLYTPKGDGPFPTVVVLSGSEGGTPENAARRYASFGYAAFAVPYFNAEGLADELSMIPLEHFADALGVARSFYGQERVALDGASRGAEAALLVAATYPELVSAVVAYSPSNVVWSGCCSEEALGKPAFTLDGQGISAAERYQSPRAVDSIVTSTDSPPSMRALFLAGMLEAQAEIPVEKIDAPILLISGDADLLWPSSIAAARIHQRLKANNFEYEVINRTYAGAGHSPASGYPFWALLSSGSSAAHPLDGLPIPLDGDPSSNAHASIDGFREVIAFLNRHVGTQVSP